MIKKICKKCKKEFLAREWSIKVGKGIFCSKECFYKSDRFHPINNKGKKLSKEHKENISKSILKWGHPKSWQSKMIGSNAFNWQENPVKATVHQYISRRYKKLDYCEFCGIKNRKFHMANKSHKYLRDIKDWFTLCVPCHKKYDLEFIKNK